MKKIDLHVHTSRYSACSHLSPEELAVMAPLSGLDGIVITEHNYQWSPDEIDELQEKIPTVKIFAGMEVNCEEGHFLVYGLDHHGEYEAGKSVSDLIVRASEEGAAVIWAHPGRFSCFPEDFTAPYWQNLAGIEVMSCNIQKKLVPDLKRLLEELKKPPVCGSDSHISLTLGTYATLFPHLPENEKELIRMIKEPVGVPWANRKALIPINGKYKDEQDKLLLSLIPLKN